MQLLNLSQLRLRTQGLLLVAFLLTFELSFVGALMLQLREAEAEALQEAHSKEILSKTQQLMFTMHKASTTMASYAVNRDKESTVAFEKLKASIRELLPWLEEAMKNHPDQAVALSRIHKNIDRGLAILDKANSLTTTMSPEQLQIELVSLQQEIDPLGKELLTDFTAFIQRMKQVVDEEAPATQRKMRQETTQILLGGVVLNITFAIMAAVFFTRGITSKLDVLVDNTERLSKGKALNPQLSGGDEISSLDRVFHKMAADLDEAQKIRQAFVAMISHELRTPLMSVKGFVQLLGMGIYGELPPDVEKGGKKAEISLERLISLINDLLDLEKLQAGKLDIAPSSMYIDDVVGKSIDALSVYAEEHKVELAFEESGIELIADPDRIVQVLVNLISNAVKFSPAGSTVTIKVNDADGAVLVQVIDQGRGVPQKYVSLIFERFKQVEAADSTSKGGTGLGLPICKCIVEQHGGSIGVDSVEGKGSTFWFKLPYKPF